MYRTNAQEVNSHRGRKGHALAAKGNEREQF